MKPLKPGKMNTENRMNFVAYCAEYVRTHPDEEWSKQQKVLIDSQIASARQSSSKPQQYLAIKGRKRNRKAAKSL